jgi:octaprenyl-diphosphate synthase
MANNKTNNIDHIVTLVQDDFNAFEAALTEQLDKRALLANELSQHLIESGGKRLRPLLVILGAKLAGYSGSAHINLAVSMEYFHTATLLHDDVVDESSLRRGKQSANAVWGAKASILVGDFLFTRAFQIISAAGSASVLALLADTSNTITKGEVLQLMNCRDTSTDEARYMEVIKAKTASLFSAATQIGGLLAERDATFTENLAAYGLHMGNAFQLIDDALDYCATSDDLGKNIGDDLMEGKPTLPLIYALHQGSAEQQQVLRTAIEQGRTDDLAGIQQILQDTRAIEYTQQRAREEVDSALSAIAGLPASPYRQALEDIAGFALSRQS